MRRIFAHLALPALLAGLILAVLAMGVSTAAHCPSDAAQGPPAGALPVPWLQGGSRVTARFQATEDGLSGVAVWLTAPEGPTSVTFSLRRDGREEAVGRGETVVANRDTPVAYVFSFPPLSDSAGQAYLLDLQAAEEGGTQGGMLYIYPDGETENRLFVDETPAHGRPALGTCYAPSGLPAWANHALALVPRLPPSSDRLLDRMSQYKPSYLKQTGWLVLGLLNLVGISWLVVHLVGRAIPRASWNLRRSLWIALALNWVLFLALTGSSLWRVGDPQVVPVPAQGDSSPVQQPTRLSAAAHDSLLTFVVGAHATVGTPENGRQPMPRMSYRPRTGHGSQNSQCRKSCYELSIGGKVFHRRSSFSSCA